MNKTVLTLAIASSLGTSLPAAAFDAGDFLVRARILNVVPDEDSDNLDFNNVELGDSDLAVSDNLSLDIDFTYFLTPNWGVELLLDISSKHNLRANGNTLRGLGVATLADVRVLPPSLLLQYHFLPHHVIKPYVGLGINYTHFFDEDFDNDAQVALGSSGLDIDDSWGVAAQVGADIDIGNDWFVNVDLKYIDVDTEVSFSSALGEVEVDVDIDPWVFGIGIGRRF